jgi:glucose/arabinose dehydrogenase
MFSSRPCGFLGSVIVLFGACCAGDSWAAAQPPSTDAQRASVACPKDDSGLKLPPGFCATVFADGIGHARHLVVAPNGVVYVNTWSGRYYGNDTPHQGGFLVALQDTTGAGKSDLNQRFGATAQTGGAGGTGIGLYQDALFAEINDQIVRYPLTAASIVPKGPAVPVVTGLPLGGDHPMHPFAIDRDGSLYVDVASASTRARSWRRAAASGAMTQTGRTRPSRRPNALPPAYVTRRVSPSKPTETSWSRNTDETSCIRIGRVGTNPNRKPRNRLRSCCA